MKKTYERPIVLANETLAEGVYAASGAGCYTTEAHITQTPEEGRNNYCIQVNAPHNATDGHHCKQQVLTLSFNKPVGYVSSNGDLIDGNGTNTLTIRYSYHNNAVDNIGFGDVYVTAEAGLAVTGAKMDDTGYQLADHSVCDSM